MKKKTPSLLLSLIVFATIMVTLIVGMLVFKLDTHILLITCLLIVCGITMTLGYTMDDLFEAMGESLQKSVVAMMFFVIIGMVIGSWELAGTVPSLIYYGIRTIKPEIFLPAGFIVCCITSFATGTSWGTCGTVGLALLGMGVGMGMPAPLVAGMIVSGSIFGDHFSPMSDTTILASTAAKTELYAHVKSMARTIIPAFIISTILYAILGARYVGEINSPEIVEMQNGLSNTFNLSFICFLPIIIVLILSFMKFPSIPTLLIGILSGILVAIFVQGATLPEVFSALNYGVKIDSGNAMVNKLIQRGGVQSMMWTFSLAFVALLLGGILEKVGYLRVLISGIVNKIKSTGQLVLLTWFTGVLGDMAMAEVYLSIILNGSLYKEVYDEKGLDRSMLSRMLEEGATLAGPLIPWTTCGAFMAATLEVKTIDYMRYAFIGYIPPIISIVGAFIGIFVIKANNAKKQA
ncbi:MAG: Na+/H+ antiporter NhaC [Vallitalea sp.]|jgi:NhaC family Na+:H+ antiporter|nr:Na+/H+ antiporter NhaC [Vallitalea sp.]